MFDEFIQSFKADPGILNICLRLACAMLVGLVIGTEREYTNRPAGMRTHVLVALGACVVAITGQVLNSQYQADPGRLAAQVITGVGFLGAGTILREGFHVKGLTTAASVWTVACLGIAAGYGYYPIALLGTLFAFVTLTILELLQDRLPGRHPVSKQYSLDTERITEALELIHAAAKAQHGDIHNISATEEAGVYLVTFRVNFTGFRSRQRSDRFFTQLAADTRVRAVTETDPSGVQVV